MREFEIRIRSVRDVLTFVNLATSRSFDVVVGNEFHRVNGKSFMEMFSLNLRRPVTVSLQCTQEEYDAFLQDAEPYLDK
mgnify:CR=1 FL=1